MYSIPRKKVHNVKILFTVKICKNSKHVYKTQYLTLDYFNGKHTKSENKHTIDEIWEELFFTIQG